MAFAIYIGDCKRRHRFMPAAIVDVAFLPLSQELRGPDLWATRPRGRVFHALSALGQRRGKALDARAGLFQQRFRGRIGDAEVGAEPECRAMHDGHSFLFQQCADEILVVGNYLARCAFLPIRAAQDG